MCHFQIQVEECFIVGVGKMDEICSTHTLRVSQSSNHSRPKEQTPSTDDVRCKADDSFSTHSISGIGIYVISDHP
jgi:hypothetical protein